MPLSDASDAALVAACRRGDQNAWRELVLRFSRYVNAIATQAYRLSPADAEDVFQEVFARTYASLDRLRSDGAVRPWIGQLTRRLCVDRLRARAREDLTGDEVEPASADETLALLDEALDVREALARLSGDCREILDRFFCRDQSYHVIAEAIGIPPGTIASRISRCLGRLREAYVGRSAPAAPSGSR